MPTKFVIREEFKKAYDESLGETILPVYKDRNVEVKVPDDPKKDIVFVISNETVDRDRDTISVDGWNLRNFKKNPVILWGHDYSMPPIANSKNLKKIDGELVSGVRFVPKEIFPFAGMIEEMVRGDFIHATSVGFQGEEVVFNEKRGGFDFKKQELLEFSIVPVPSNAEALVQAKSQGINIVPMIRWAEQLMVKNFEMVENDAVHDMTWLKWLDENIKQLDKKTVTVDLDLMETKGTIFVEPPKPSETMTMISNTSNVDNLKVVLEPITGAEVAKDIAEKIHAEKIQEAFENGRVSKECELEEIEEAKNPTVFELELEQKQEDTVVLALEPEEPLFEMEREEPEAFSRDFVESLMADVKEQTRDSLAHIMGELNLEAVVAKAFRQQRGRLD
jgi:hypothetical protein